MKTEEEIKHLKNSLIEIPNLYGKDIRDASFNHWHQTTRVVLETICGKGSIDYANFINSQFRPPRVLNSDTNYPIPTLALDSCKELLERLIESKQKEEERNDIKHKIFDSNKNDVFIVHGHNENILNEVDKYITCIYKKPIVLRDKPGKCQALINKFEEYSNTVRFAVVLMTGDDMGCAKNDSPKKLELRARQNVIFELGFFCALLERKNVCILVEEGIEMHTDFDGVNFIPLNSEWKNKLALEMQTAGVQVDLNKLIVQNL